MSNNLENLKVSHRNTVQLILLVEFCLHLVKSGVGGVLFTQSKLTVIKPDVFGRSPARYPPFVLLFFVIFPVTIIFFFCCFNTASKLFFFHFLVV